DRRHATQVELNQGRLLSRGEVRLPEAEHELEQLPRASRLGFGLHDDCPTVGVIRLSPSNAQGRRGQPGPKGSPSEYQAKNIRTQAPNVIAAYGSMSATTVPTPAFFSYTCANPMTRAKWGSKGLMTLGGESLTR